MKILLKTGLFAFFNKDLTHWDTLGEVKELLYGKGMRASYKNSSWIFCISLGRLVPAVRVGGNQLSFFRNAIKWGIARIMIPSRLPVLSQLDFDTQSGTCWNKRPTNSTGVAKISSYLAGCWKIKNYELSRIAGSHPGVFGTCSKEWKPRNMEILYCWILIRFAWIIHLWFWNTRLW